MNCESHFHIVFHHTKIICAKKILDIYGYSHIQELLRTAADLQSPAQYYLYYLQLKSGKLSLEIIMAFPHTPRLFLQYSGNLRKNALTCIFPCAVWSIMRVLLHLMGWGMGWGKTNKRKTMMSLLIVVQILLFYFSCKSSRPTKNPMTNCKYNLYKWLCSFTYRYYFCFFPSGADNLFSL